jgi:hypothetical protein
MCYLVFIYKGQKFLLGDRTNAFVHVDAIIPLIFWHLLYLHLFAKLI